MVVGPSGTAPVTPEEIVYLILEEMRAEVAPLFYTNLVRSVFHVYLAPGDLERLRAVLPRVREEAVRALNEELRKLNQGARPKLRIPFLNEPRRQKPYEALGDWLVEFHENTDDDAEENPLIIQSVFATPVEMEDRAGTMTERITRRGADGRTATSIRPVADTQRPAGEVHATLEYQDDRGPQTYRMAKDQIKVGRGSVDRWVDLKLFTRKDVSREHLQIRRDPGTGRFFVKDLSSLGTSVNGKRVAPSLEVVDGETVDRNIEAPLPEKARISLAGVLDLEFRAVRPQ